MKRLELPGGLVIWLQHVLAELAGEQDGKPIVMLQFDTAATMGGSSPVVTPGSQPQTGSIQPAAVLLNPEQTAVYRRAVEPFTVRPPGPPPRAMPN